MIPYRGTPGNGTCFITASTFEKQCILQPERMAGLLINVLSHYQQQGKYQLHEFVVMPNHFPLQITPLLPLTLEKTIQFIKGGFSYRARRNWDLLGKSGRPVSMTEAFGMRLSIDAAVTTSP